MKIPVLLAIGAIGMNLTAAHAQTPPVSAPPIDCDFHVWGDDRFELFINGQLAWSDADWGKILKKTVPLRKGDVVVFTVTDDQGGPEGGFAAVIIRDNVALASSKDFRYTVNPPAGFTTDSSIHNLRVPDLDILKMSFGLGPDKQPKKAWTHTSDRKFGVAHFKYVVH